MPARVQNMMATPPVSPTRASAPSAASGNDGFEDLLRGVTRKEPASEPVKSTPRPKTGKPRSARAKDRTRSTDEAQEGEPTPTEEALSATSDAAPGETAEQVAPSPDDTTTPADAKTLDKTAADGAEGAAEQGAVTALPGADMHLAADDIVPAYTEGDEAPLPGATAVTPAKPQAVEADTGSEPAYEELTGAASAGRPTVSAANMRASRPADAPADEARPALGAALEQPDQSSQPMGPVAAAEMAAMPELPQASKKLPGDSVKVARPSADTTSTPPQGVDSPAARPAGASAPATPATLHAPEVRFADENHEKIVTGVHAQLLPKGGTMQIRLDPPELGALKVMVEMRDGVMNATFQTSNDQATQLLSHSLNQLKHMLEAQGTPVERLQVQQAPRSEQSRSNSEGQSDQSQQQWSDEHAARQEQQRKELLQRMWRKVNGLGDPIDFTA